MSCSCYLAVRYNVNRNFVRGYHKRKYGPQDLVFDSIVYFFVKHRSESRFYGHNPGGTTDKFYLSWVRLCSPRSFMLEFVSLSLSMFTCRLIDKLFLVFRNLYRGVSGILSFRKILENKPSRGHYNCCIFIAQL